MKFKTVPRLVVTDEDFETLRVIRNTCRHGFTGDTKEIARDEQHRYATRAHINPLLRHYIYSYDGIDVGFSRLEWKDGFINPTMGVASWARGKGFAWDIVKQLLLAAGGPLKGTLLRSNEAIVKVDLTLGFTPCKIQPSAETMDIMCDWPPPVEIWNE